MKVRFPAPQEKLVLFLLFVCLGVLDHTYVSAEYAE